MSQIVLLGSVFLPAAVFGPLADALAEHGHRVRVAGAEHATTPDEVLEAYLAAIGDPHGVVGVAHSNAGAYVPALVSSGGLDSVVFMDAVLPNPDGGEHDVVRSDPGDVLRAHVVDGALPRWTEWWPIDEVRPLFPDEPTFADVNDATPRVAAEYLDGTVEVPAGWTGGVRAAFLAFGETYADERRLAASLGWPTRTMGLAHLGFLQQPNDVARELTALINGWPGPRPS
jgi:hypothetical protein